MTQTNRRQVALAVLEWMLSLKGMRLSFTWNDLGRLWPWDSKSLKPALLLELHHQKFQALFVGVSSFQRVPGAVGAHLSSLDLSF